MRKNPNQKLILSAVLIFFIVAAVSGCSGLIKPKKGTGQADAHTGIIGVEMKFMQNAPPKEIIMPGEDQKMPFQVGINMENKGAYDIKDGYLLLAVEKDYMGIKGWQMAGERKSTQIGASGEKLSFKLKGRSSLEPVGETDTVFADVEALPLDRQSITHTSTVRATACYDYETTANADVCIDPDAYNVNPSEKVCTVKDVSLSGGQGGPITIDKIEVGMLPNAEEGKEKSVSPQFTIHISNKGEGIAFRSDKVRDACSPTPLKTDEINTVTVDDVSFSGYSLSAGHIECIPKQIKIRGVDDKTMCRVKKGIIKADSGTYKTPLQIVLKYGYSQTISQDVTINRAR